MQKLSVIANLLQVGVKAEASSTLKACTINAATGTVDFTVGGNDMGVSNNGTTATGQFIAEKVWNSVWNDIVDYQTVCDEVVFGKCYFDTFDGARICNKRNQKSIIGVASDTFGFGVGVRQDIRQVPIAVCGWVLAFVDKVYEPGTVLTCNEYGDLTEMTHEEKVNYPERIVGIYKRPEAEKYFGTENKKIEVNGRHWIKVR
jgi:hypothetical protein